jgi:hypothetical protein
MYTIAKKALILLFLISSFSACAPEAGRYVPAPALIQGTKAEMNTPGFWIGLLENPDEIIIPEEDIAAFNETIRDGTGKIKEITQYPSSYQGQWLAETFSAAIGAMMKRKNFTLDGKKAKADFFEDIEANMDIDGIPSEVKVRFGFVVAYTHQRVLPTSSGLYSKKMNHAFDRLQNSALDLGTPVVILHETADKKWFYADSPLSAGWIRAEDVGLCTREQMVHYATAEPFVVTLRAKTDIFLDEDLRGHHAYVRMGSRFACRYAQKQGLVEILLPVRAEDGSLNFAGGFLSEKDIHRGYLPYTQRTIITQAFQLLNTPYGWGGMYGEQDCSRFIQEIFATAGIFLPRNSSQQAKVGRLAAQFDESITTEERRQLISRDAAAGITLLQMSGHIMLYLGMTCGENYAIHDMWGYGEKDHGRENLRVVNRVVVTTLSLGTDTKSGSLLDRLIMVRTLALQ